MEYTRFGSTGMKVSKICLGCMSYGDPQGRWPWALHEEASRPFIKRALELGINFFDTADVYSNGVSEEITGRALRDFATRDEVVIATKVHGAMGPGPNDGGLSRKHILSSIDASLKRLGMDYVDLYQIHRWDYETPIEETLEALQRRGPHGQGALHRRLVDVRLAVCQGAVHRRPARLGALRLDAAALQPGLPRRRARDAAPVPGPEDRRHPLVAAGARAADRQTRKDGGETERARTDAFAKRLYVSDDDFAVANRVDEVASQRAACPSAQVALAWMLSKPVITAPIIGATKLNHLDDAVAAVSLKLSEDEIGRLEELYKPHPVLGFV